MPHYHALNATFCTNILCNIKGQFKTVHVYEFLLHSCLGRNEVTHLAPLQPASCHWVSQLAG